MLANLVKKGFEVVAFDVVPGALDVAVRLGAGRAGSAGGMSLAELLSNRKVSHEV